VEHIIREDFNMEALEIIELYCEMLLARFGMIEQMKYVAQRRSRGGPPQHGSTFSPVASCGSLVGRDLDPSIEEAVFSLCYAAPRVEVPELANVRDQLLAKYGKQMEQKTGGGAKDKVPPGQSTAFVNARVRHHRRPVTAPRGCPV